MVWLVTAREHTGTPDGDEMEAAKSIFIASSMEARPTAEQISQILASKNLLPVPWWEAFPPGSYTFDQLNKQSRAVDGAIFLAMKDDKVWYRDSEQGAPRDNVILEYGLFAARLGLDRCLILSDKDVKIPSDLRGVTYEPLGNVDQSILKLAKHFTDLFGTDKVYDGPAPFKIVCDPQLASYQVAKELPDNWLTRAMYVGTEGARAWLAISKDPRYQTDVDRAELQGHIADMLKKSRSSFRTFVSLGPGDGEMDKCIALQLLEREPTVQCIPVDLSDGLLYEAIRVLSQHIRVPVGLLTDFEDNIRFVIQQVQEYGKPPYLYSLLGNTFGNLDKTEPSFMQTFAKYLKPGDEFLIEVTVTKDAPGQQAVVDLSKWGEGARRFYSHGAARRLGRSTHQVFDDFSKAITVSVRERGNAISGTRLLTFCIEGTPFARARRYDLRELERFFSDRGFQVRSARINVDEDDYDIGLFALAKP